VGRPIQFVVAPLKGPERNSSSVFAAFDECVTVLKMYRSLFASFLAMKKHCTS
jgi:hypothetical protein